MGHILGMMTFASFLGVLGFGGAALSLPHWFWKVAFGFALGVLTFCCVIWLFFFILGGGRI